MGYRRDPKSKALVLDPEPQDQRIDNLKKILFRFLNILHEKKLLPIEEAVKIEKEIQEI